MEVSQEQFQQLVREMKTCPPETPLSATQQFSMDFYMRDVEVRPTHKVQTGVHDWNFEFLPSGEVKKGKLLFAGEKGNTFLILYSDGTLKWEYPNEIRILPIEE